jgi:hypothetical protein
VPVSPPVEVQPQAELAWTSLNRDGTLNQQGTAESSLRPPGIGSKLSIAGALLLGAGMAVAGALWFVYGRDSAPVIIADAPEVPVPVEEAKAARAGEGTGQVASADRAGQAVKGADHAGQPVAGSGAPGREDGAAGGAHAAGEALPGRSDGEHGAPGSEVAGANHPEGKKGRGAHGRAGHGADAKPAKGSRSEDRGSSAAARSDPAEAAKPDVHPPSRAEASAAAAPARGSITVLVKSSGGQDTTAAIFVDNRDIGRLSPLKAFPLGAGKHHVEIRLGSGGKPRAKDVVVEPGKESEVFFIAD